jgi:hypothetical protein
LSKHLPIPPRLLRRRIRETRQPPLTIQDPSPPTTRTGIPAHGFPPFLPLPPLLFHEAHPQDAGGTCGAGIGVILGSGEIGEGDGGCVAVEGVSGGVGGDVGCGVEIAFFGCGEERVVEDCEGLDGPEEDPFLFWCEMGSVAADCRAENERGGIGAGIGDAVVDWEGSKARGEGEREGCNAAGVGEGD